MAHEWRYIQKLCDRKWTGWKKQLTLMERALLTGQYPPPPFK
jgi:hypothetical protein